jgi:AcrR family transcriptional regulator
VARTVNQAAHALRRDAFLDVAERLVQTKGYAKMSVQDVLSELNTSKGAFYHYFDSKQALLEALIERTADTLTKHLTPVATASGGALERLQRFFGALAGWKLERQDLLLGMLRDWYADDNAVVRQKLRPRITGRIAPLLARIVRDGVAQGVFTAAYPDQTGRVLVSLVHDLNDAIADLLLSQEPSATALPAINQTIAAYTSALERVLGIPAGSLVLVDPAAVATWLAAPTSAGERG